MLEEVSGTGMLWGAVQHLLNAFLDDFDPPFVALFNVALTTLHNVIVEWPLAPSDNFFHTCAIF